MSLPSPPPPLSTPSRPRPRPTHRTSGSSGGSFDAAALDSNNPMLAGLSLSGFTPGGPVPAGYSYLDKAAPTLRTSTRSGPRDAAAGPMQKKKAPRPATRFVPPRSTSPVSPHDRAIPSSLASSPSPPRSKTLPSLTQLNTTLHSLASLPANPRAWTPTHVSLYLSHVLSLAPRPIIEDVARFVRSEQLSGPGFLRLREGQLEARGMNPRWRRLLCEASERLRREGLRRRIWSRPHGVGEEEEEPSMEALLGDVGGAGELTPGQQRLMTATLKRIRDRKAVRGLIDAIESSPPKDVAELPPSHTGTPTRKIKKTFPALDGVGSTERSSPTVIEPPFGEGYVRRQANSFSSQESLAKMAREGAKAQRIRPSRTRMWTSGSGAKEASDASFPSSISTSAISEFGSRPLLHSSVSSPGDLEWAQTHAHAHGLSASSSSSSSSISTSTSTSSITSALGYESDFSATSESDVADFDDEVGIAGQREEQQPFWMTTLPIDEEMVRAMLAEQEDEAEAAAAADREPETISLLQSEAKGETATSSSADEEDAHFQPSREEEAVDELAPTLELESAEGRTQAFDNVNELSTGIVGDGETLDTMATLTATNRRLFVDIEEAAEALTQEQAHQETDDVFTCQRHEDPAPEPEPEPEPEQRHPQEYEHDIEATLRAPRRNCSSLAIQSLLLPSSNADEEGERFDSIKLDEDSLATIRQGRRGASSGSSQGGEEEGVGGSRGGRRSLQQLSEMFCTPCESAGEEEPEKVEEPMKIEAEEVPEEAPAVKPQEMEGAIEELLEELATAPLIQQDQHLEEEQDCVEPTDADNEAEVVAELEPTQVDREELQVDLPLVVNEEDDKVQDNEQTIQDDIVVPTLTTQHCVNTDTESSLEDSTILRLIHTREVSAASSVSPEAFAAAAAAEATDVSADTALLKAEEDIEEHQEHHETSSNPDDDDDAHIWYGDGASLLLLSSLLPDRTEDELLISEHRRLLPSRTSSPKDGRKRRALPPWSWADLVARTPPYLVGLATGVAFVVVSEMVLGMRRRR